MLRLRCRSEAARLLPGRVKTVDFRIQLTQSSSIHERRISSGFVILRESKRRKVTSNLNKISIAIEYKNRLVLLGFGFNDFVPLAPREAVKKSNISTRLTRMT